MVKKAYKQKFGFLTKARAKKYLLFLKQHILKLKPRFYAVIHCREIITSDGKMYALRITTDIEHPGFEPIAEAWINGQYIYLWKDHCWAVAVDEKEKQILQYDNRMLNPNDVSLRDKHLNKTILLFKIGMDRVE